MKYVDMININDTSIKIYWDDILHINFTTEKMVDTGEMFDVSLDKDRSVVAWTNGRILNVSSQDKNAVIVAPKDFSGFFMGLQTLEGICFDNLDTSRVVSMANLFLGCRSLKYIDVSRFNTSNVEDMSKMFSQCSNLVDVYGFGMLNCAFVENMSAMFQGCSSLVSLDLSDMNVKRVLDVSKLIADCGNIKSFAANGWDTRRIQKMSGIFDGCPNLSSINLIGWDAVHKQEAFVGLFTKNSQF